jgi:hypothetical protein
MLLVVTYLSAPSNLARGFITRPNFIFNPILGLKQEILHPNTTAHVRKQKAAELYQ